ncbi:MAG: putative transposase [Patescibacteria group bacterium]|nr:putative transposase [Patescibacteria group bacterium]
MKVNDLVPVGHYRYYVNTTNSNHKYRVFENLLERNFVADKPNQAWVGDITYIPTAEGWLYLATVIDIFSRRVIAQSDWL